MKKVGRQKKQTGADGHISRPRTTSPASLSIPFLGLARRAFAEREGGRNPHQSFGFKPGRMGSACAFNVNSGTCFESAAISELHRTKEKWCGEAGVR
jgi:hypothetical protein